jgi:hypothetical protein
MLHQLHWQLTADEYRRARLMHVKREVEKLKREELPPHEVLARAAIAALASLVSEQAEARPHK